MRIPTSLRWPLLCVGGFFGLCFGLFSLAGLGPTAAADGALALLAGTHPQLLSFSEVEALRPGVVLLLFAGGLVVRIFLIAFWAAYLVRKSSEASAVRKLRRQLNARMRPETAELPALRSIHWN
ncbi:MAG: hypothetical protein ABIP12_07340 [Terriglobales bacterium]